MASLTEHTILNGLEENLKNAIEEAGGVVPEDSCLWSYPDIIKNQLMSPGQSDRGNIVAGDGIKVELIDGNIVISTTDSEPIIIPSDSENITIDTITAPQWSGISTWPEGTTLQKILEDLFNVVIPKIPSVYKGDVTITDDNGIDPFSPNPECYIDSLTPNTPYLRLFLVSQVDPIYISLEKALEGIINIDLTNYYTKSETENLIKTIEFDSTASEETVTIEQLVDKTLTNENTISNLNQTVINQTEQITEIQETLSQFASTEDAEETFNQIFTE